MDAQDTFRDNVLQARIGIFALDFITLALSEFLASLRIRIPQMVQSSSRVPLSGQDAFGNVTACA
jgi:hypothetical protein